MSHPFYLAYGVLLLGLVGTAEYRGWAFTPADRVTNVPRTVRDNPGAYRSHYAFLPRYVGGK